MTESSIPITSTIHDFLTISDIPALSQRCGYLLALGLFLDSFYKCDSNKKLQALEVEPQQDILKPIEYCKLAAAAHKLAQDYLQSVPEWVMKSEYVMPYPIYAFDTEDSESHELLKQITPDEYKIRNLFLGPGVLKRA